MSAHRMHARRTGFVLLAVLWVMVGLTTLGLGAALLARRATRASRNRRDEIVAYWNAADCLEYAETVASAVLAGQADGADGRPLAWGDLDATVANAPLARSAGCRLALRAAGTTLDVNTASGEMLHGLFAALALAPGRADSLTDAILDWRDPDGEPRPLGAERDWYVGHGRAPPRDGPLADPRELRRVRGVAALPGLDTLLGTEPGRLVLDRAPLPVLAALPGLGDEAIARIAELRARGARIADLLALAAQLSPAARAAMLARYADLARLTAPEPDAWLVQAEGHAPASNITVVIEVRLVRAGRRAAIVRRREWLA